ncbi:hypothetical protein LO763_19710 [Glycomyces sp. A-F 0318]|uniref:hypothetical protein n=1 Tax=Glycomyces amatae TaxID=2881355 RepID=UPI001E4639B9|nr:hypothetical protein [Glycomyces amatae]MCD0445839.1 hypothetical protein [Glycomyces amatae]
MNVIAPRNDGGAALALAERIGETVPAAAVVVCPDGHDLNSAFRAGVAGAVIDQCRDEQP